MSAEIPAAAAHPQHRSSNANSLCCAVLAKSSKVIALIQMDFDPATFGSSSPSRAATQCVSTAWDLQNEPDIIRAIGTFALGAAAAGQLRDDA